MNIQSARDSLAQKLKDTGKKVVFAESCTAGLCSATMAQVDGISNHLVGSAVTYRPAAKRDWLGVDQASIEAYSCESQEVAEEMALGVLKKSVEADWCGAVVGHLADGQACFVWIAVANQEPTTCKSQVVLSKRFVLQSSSRSARQTEASCLVLEALAAAID